MAETGQGEVHFISGTGDVRVDFIDNFPFPTRNPDEKLIEFKGRVTGTVQRASEVAIGREVVAIKWRGPLGYHFGFDPR